MSFPRMTTRRWVLGVAIVASFTGATIAARRARLYRRCAEFHAAKERLSLAYAKDPTTARLLCGTNFWGVPMLDSDPCIRRPGASRAWSVGDHLKDAAFHQVMRRRYERAVRYPWLSVPRVPPEPE